MLLVNLKGLFVLPSIVLSTVVIVVEAVESSTVTRTVTVLLTISPLSFDSCNAAITKLNFI